MRAEFVKWALGECGLEGDRSKLVLGNTIRAEPVTGCRFGDRCGEAEGVPSSVTMVTEVDAVGSVGVGVAAAEAGSVLPPQLVSGVCSAGSQLGEIARADAGCGAAVLCWNVVVLQVGFACKANLQFAVGCPLAVLAIVTAGHAVAAASPAARIKALLPGGEPLLFCCCSD
jgi:hypothetical protein